MTFQNPFAQAAFNTGAGLGQGTNPRPLIDQQILEELFGGGNQPTIEEVLGSRLSRPVAQSVAQNLSQGREREGKLQLQQFQELQKQQDQALKQQNEQQQRQAAVNLITGITDEFDPQQLENLSPTQLNDLVRNLTKKSDKPRPVEVAFSEKIKEDVKQRSNVLDEVDRTSQIFDLVQDPNTSFDSFQGKLRSATQGTFLERFVPIPTSQAQLNNLIVSGAKELKNSFGARVTNFDFAKWLSGQPGVNKRQAANFALALMANNNAKMRAETNELTLEAANLFGDDSNAALKWVRSQEEAIRRKWSNATVEALKNFKQQPTESQRGTGRGTSQESVPTSQFEGSDRLRTILG